MKPSAKTKEILLAGEVPLIVVAMFCVGAFAVGRQSAPARDRVAVGEKGAVVLEAVLANPHDTPDEADALITKPIFRVLEKYRHDGYTVIDASRDAAGHLEVAALPEAAIDITSELRAAVTRPAPVTRTAVTIEGGGR